VFNKKFIPLLGIRLLPIAAQTVLIVLSLNLMGPFFAGNLALFLSCLTVFRAIAPAGLDLEVLRVSSRSVDNRGTLSRTLLITVMRKISLFTLAGLGCLLLLALALPKLNLVLFAVMCAAVPTPSIGVLTAFLRPSRSLIKSQSVDALISNLIPTMASIALIYFGLTDLKILSVAFLISGTIAAVLLFRMAMKVSSKNLRTAELQNTNIKSNGIAQILVALNARIPTLVTGVFASPEVVAYVDLGSKIQLIGGTVAWLFGVIQSPTYARDEEKLSQSSKSLIAKSTLWSSLISGTLGTALALAAFVFASQLNLDPQILFVVLATFTVVTIIESWFVSLGYGLSMTGRSSVISWSVVAQMVVSVVGVSQSNENLVLILMSLAAGSVSRLVVVKYLTSEKR